MLPGALQRPEDFLAAGFAEGIRRRGLALDLALIDFEMQFLSETLDGSALQQLHEAAMGPLRSRNYRQVWLAGVSIGGFMALAYAERYPGMVDGLCLLGPYPGNRMLANEIRAAGGVQAWAGANDGESDGERRVWRWLRQHRGMSSGPAIHMGYGSDDRFASGHRLMADALAAHQVDVVAGGHDWPAWQQLWENFLDRISPEDGTA